MLVQLRIRGLSESSGLAASRSNPGVFWSHNDSGNPAELFAFTRDGKPVGRWTIPRARNYDWEDLAIGPGPRRGASYLYIADTGDNERKRESITVYRVPEPDTRRPARTSATAEAFVLRYPDHPHDAEALLVHPVSGDLYIVTKARGEDSRTLVFKASAPLWAGPTTLTLVSEVKLPGHSLFSMVAGRVTGAAVSPDGKRVMICDYFSGWEAVLPDGASFDTIWKRNWAAVDLGDRPQGESITYGPNGRSVYATSEGVVSPLVEVVRGP